MKKELLDTDIQSDLTPSLSIPTEAAIAPSSTVNVEVQAAKKRKCYTASYKMRVLDELDRGSVARILNVSCFLRLHLS